jgi:hypothetical protein
VIHCPLWIRASVLRFDARIHYGHRLQIGVPTCIPRSHAHFPQNCVYYQRAARRINIKAVQRNLVLRLSGFVISRMHNSQKPSQQPSRISCSVIQRPCFVYIFVLVRLGLICLNKGLELDLEYRGRAAVGAVTGNKTK